MTNTKVSKRHSAADQEHLDKAASHLAKAGAAVPTMSADMPNAAADAKQVGARYTYKADGKAVAGHAKSVDLDEWTGRVRGEFYEEFASNSPYGPVNNWWVERVYDDAVIISTGDEYYRVPYTLTGTDVEFAPVSQWQEVQRAYVPVAAPALDAAKTNETLIAYGGTLKSVGDKFAGLLVKYSTEDDPDLTGDYFTKDTDYGVEDGAVTPIYFHHRLPLKTRDGQEIRIKSKIGEGVIRFKEDGAYLEDAILYNRTEYEKAITKQAKKGLFGLSSGTASHFVEREFTGKAFKITEWLLGIDASVTPTPAEPRTNIAPVKSLPAMQIDFDLPDPEALSPEGAATTAPASGAAVKTNGTGAPAPNTLEDEMSNEQYAKLLTLMEAQGAELAAIKAKWNEPPDNKGALATTVKGTQAPAQHKTPLGDDAFKAFNWFLKTGDPSGIRTGEAYEGMLVDRNVKTTYSLLESTQYQGQEAVPTEVIARIIERRDQISVLRAAGAQVIPVGSNAATLPIEKASPEVFAITTVDGSNTFDQTTVQPMDKLAATIYLFTRSVPIDMQLLDDSVVNIEAWWGRRMARAWGLTENKYFLTGSGSSQPQGLTAGGTSAFTSASGLALTAGEIIKLYHALAAEYRDNVAWAMSGASESTLRQLSAGPYPFLGNGGYNGGVGMTGLAQGTGWLVDARSKVFNGSDCASIGVNNKPVFVFNAEAGYAIFERKGLTVFRDPYTLANKGQVNILAYFRETGGVVNSAAVQYVTMASA